MDTGPAWWVPLAAAGLAAAGLGAAIGVLAGGYPAWRAARLEPIAAIRAKA